MDGSPTVGTTLGRLVRALFGRNTAAEETVRPTFEIASAPPVLWLSQVEPFIRRAGTCTVNIQGSDITFDMTQPHERAYAVRTLMDVRHPQSDIDAAVLGLLVRSGDRVLDAGANIGMTALECIKSGAESVTAVEADPVLHARLSKLQARGLTPVAAAIAAHDGYAELLLSQTHNQGATLSAAHLERFAAVYGEERKYVSVRTACIDTLVREYGAFDVWKLDIEGAEAEALKGAVKTLRDCPPRAIVAELFPHVFNEFVDAIAPTHRHSYRALIRERDYALVLAPLHEPPPPGYCHTSPTYIFSASPLLVKEHG